MRLKLLLIFSFLLLTPNWSITQSPSYFALGEEELSGLDVYDIYQDKDKNYWIGTENGIYKFDGYDFKQITCKEMMAPSVFAFTEGPQNGIYCNNLSGQIFQIIDDKCTVYYTVPDSLMTSVITFVFDKADNLYIRSKKVFKIDKHGVYSLLNQHFDVGRVTCRNLQQTESGRVFYYSFGSKGIELDEIDTNGTIKPRLMHYPDEKSKRHLFSLQEIDNSIYFNTYEGGTIYKIENDSFKFFKQLEFKINTNGFYTSSNDFWISDFTKGVYRCDKETRSLKAKNPLYPTAQISAFEEDNEGNLLFGTFGKGVMVIPSPNTVDIDLGIYTNFITELAIGPEGNLVLGTSINCILEIDHKGNIKKHNTEKKAAIEAIEYINCTDEFLYFQSRTYKYNRTKKQVYHFGQLGAIKDIAEILPNEYLVSTNKGVSFYHPLDSFKFKAPASSKWRDSKEGVKMNTQFSRSNCAHYDPINAILYFGTAIGLQILTDEKVEEFKINGEPIFCQDFQRINGLMYVATQRKGILIFENGELIKKWDVDTPLISNNVKQIRFNDTLIVISTDEGIQLLNHEGESQRILNESYGLYTKRITDFEIQDNHLWLLHPNGVQQLNLSTIDDNLFEPTIAITEIRVNDESIDDFNAYSKLNYTQNKISFLVSSKSLRYQKDIHYQYRLIGVDKTWQTNSYANNLIAYKTLPPNNYKFEVKAVYQQKESPLQSFSFSIHPPFWDTWWFYTLVFIFTGGVILTGLLIFVRRQRRKTLIESELNGLKLTALKSQMNPHFIFNALNSIQDLILSSDVENSYRYVTKFSELVRRILNFSGEDFILFEDEIKALNLYIELESLRFKNQIKTKLKTNDINDILIPPLLIQPFVENAVKHGLLHKKGEKQLAVSFELETVLVCTIQDNGIGRKKAKEIQQRQNKNHQSFATQSIKKRLHILEQLYHKEGLGFEYIDHFDNAESTGTTLKLFIPYKHKF